MKRKGRKSLPWRRFGYVILIIIKFGKRLLWISLKIINALRSYIKDSKECFIQRDQCKKHKNWTTIYSFSWFILQHATQPENTDKECIKEIWWSIVTRKNSKTFRGRFSSWPSNLRFAPCEVVEGNTGFGIHSFFLEFWTHDLWRPGRFPPFLGFWMPLNFVVGFPLSRGWALESCHGVSDSRGKRSRWYRLLNYLMWGGQKL